MKKDRKSIRKEKIIKYIRRRWFYVGVTKQRLH